MLYDRFAPYFGRFSSKLLSYMLFVLLLCPFSGDAVCYSSLLYRYYLIPFHYDYNSYPQRALTNPFSSRLINYLLAKIDKTPNRVSPVTVLTANWSITMIKSSEQMLSYPELLIELLRVKTVWYKSIVVIKVTIEIRHILPTL